MATKIPEELQRRIDALTRNDPDECEAIAEALVYAIGFVPSSTAHTMFMLQDDDEDLRKRLTGRPIRPMPGQELPQ